MPDDGRLRVAARDDLGDPVRLAERGDERGRVGGRRDEVEVAHGLAAAAHAARLGDGDRGRMRGAAPRRRASPPGARARAARGPRRAPSAPAPSASAFRIFSSLLAPMPDSVAQPALLGRRLEPVERRDAELGPDARGGLRADAGKPKELDDAGRHEPAAASSARASRRPRRSRRPSARSSSRSRAGRSRGPRARARPPGPGVSLMRVAARRYAMTRNDSSPRISEMSARRSSWSAISALRGNVLRHAAMICTCLAPSSACRRTTSARTSSRWCARSARCSTRRATPCS